MKGGAGVGGEGVAPFSGGGWVGCGVGGLWVGGRRASFLW